MPTVAQLEAPTYRTPSVTADNVIFVDLTKPEDLALFKGWQSERPDKRGEDPEELDYYVLTIERKNPPYPGDEGYRCLAGGFVDYGECPHKAAGRELDEETHLDKPPKLRLIGVYGDPERDQRRNVITIAKGCLMPPKLLRHAYGGDDALKVHLVPMKKVFKGEVKFGFDHLQIVLDGWQVIMLNKHVQ